MAFTRWDPLRDLLALHEQFGQLVGNDAPGWTPPVDLYETASAFVLTAEVPGLSRDDVEIHAEESRIVIRGQRATGGVACEQYHRVERGHGRFSRTFLLSCVSDAERAFGLRESRKVTRNAVHPSGLGVKSASASSSTG